MKKTFPFILIISFLYISNNLYSQSFESDEIKKIFRKLEKSVKDYSKAVIGFSHEKQFSKLPKKRQKDIDKNYSKISELYFNDLYNVDIFQDLIDSGPGITVDAETYYDMMKLSKQISILLEANVNVDAPHAFNQNLRIDGIDYLNQNLVKKDGSSMIQIQQDFGFVNTRFKRRLYRVPEYGNIFNDMKGKDIVVCWRFKIERKKNGKLKKRKVDKKDFEIIGIIPYSAYEKYSKNKFTHTIKLFDQAPPTDTDGDGTPDKYDNCPNDPNKIEPGVCECGQSETDSDGDGTPDCEDKCPNDPNKTEPGVCECGQSETDSDGDGTPDCKDKCPNDSNKTEPEICGCGQLETDNNGDGIPDCQPYQGKPKDTTKVLKVIQNQGLRNLNVFFNSIAIKGKTQIAELPEKVASIFERRHKNRINVISCTTRKITEYTLEEYYPHLARLTYPIIQLTPKFFEISKSLTYDEASKIWEGGIIFQQEFKGKNKVGKCVYCDITFKKISLKIIEEGNGYRVLFGDIWIESLECPEDKKKIKIKSAKSYLRYPLEKLPKNHQIKTDDKLEEYYKIQLMAFPSDKKPAYNYSIFKYLGQVKEEFYPKENLVRVVLEGYNTYDMAQLDIHKVRNQGVWDAFIVKYKNGLRMGH